MTAAAAAAQGPGWRRHLVPLLLAVSLALNLCFVAGAMWIRFAAPPPGPAARLEAAAAQLSLDARQQAAFQQYVGAITAQIRQMHDQIAPLIGEAWSELAKPQADEASVMQRFDAAAQKRRNFQRQLTTETLAFLATLSPEQRAKFVELARHHFWSHHHDHRPRR
jgi:uncharacterized membrane protein